MVDAPYSYLCPALMLGPKFTSEQTYLHNCILNANRTFLSHRSSKTIVVANSTLRLTDNLLVLESVGNLLH